MPTIYKPKKKREYQDYNKKREKRQSVYNTARWRAIRLAYLMQHPISEISEWLGETALADDLHHIVSFLDVPESEMLRYAYDSNNLIAVTRQEHNRLHNGDLQGCRSKAEIKAKALEINKIRKCNSPQQLK